MNNSTNLAFQTKKHFEILDGLRGIAAIIIVIFHFMEIVYEPSKNFLAHGFLAVDFFFCLSGFVIAYAYQDRIVKMKLKDFFTSRFIRLHPLVICGAVLGLAAFVFNPFSNHVASYEISTIALLFAATLFMIPLPIMPDRYFNLFGLNAPAWSLFWEYVANILYALFLHKLKKVQLLFLAIIAAFALCYTSYSAGGSLLGGWNDVTFWHGFARISYSFLAGMFIYHSNWSIKNSMGFAGLSALLIIAFIVPFSDLNWITEPFIVLFYFPLIIVLGKGANLASGMKSTCTLLGNLSYPLYMTHYMVMFIFADYYTTYKPANTELYTIIGVGTLALIAFAYLIMKYFDSPIRQKLTSWTRK